MSQPLNLKKQLLEQFGKVAKALGSGPRLEIVDFLSQAERTVEDLADLASLSVANASQHLQVLRRAGLVEVRRDGPYSFYRLSGASVIGLWKAIREAGENHMAEVERVLKTFEKNRESMEAIGADELSRRLKAGTVTLIDVRPAAEYAAGHIPGAISCPVETLRKRLRDLSRKTQIVAYCRGPYCLQSDEAVALLVKQGFTASRLEYGLPEWRAEGRKVERASTNVPQHPNRGKKHHVA